MEPKPLFSPAPKKTLREELIEARDTIRRQIEICQSPSALRSAPDYRAAIAELEAELSQIEDAIRDLGAAGADGG
jgi:hypothetical protein